MGLYANYPIALAPGMSLNAYFTYAVCLNMHVPWQTALAVVFFSGVAFLLLTVTRVREQIVNGMPDCLKHSTATGIGMFIASSDCVTPSSWSRTPLPSSAWATSPTRRCKRLASALS